MQWYHDLYLGEKVAKKKNKIIYKIKDGKFTPSTYVIALPRNDYDTLEAFPAVTLREDWYKKADIFIVGLAKGNEEANEVMETIIKECYEETNDVNVREFILDREARKDEIKVVVRK